MDFNDTRVKLDLEKDTQDMNDLINNELIMRALTGALIIPNYSFLLESFENILEDEHGVIIDVCSVDGQKMHLGNDICVHAMEMASLLVYALILEKDIDLSDKVAREPSGVDNASGIFNSDGIPYNAFMWNGFIYMLSLIDVDDVYQKWTDITRSNTIQFDEQYEKDDRECHFHQIMSIIYGLKWRNKIDGNPSALADLFFKLRSMVCNISDYSLFAASLSNEGYDVFGKKYIYSKNTCKHVQSMLFSCGSGKKSGEIAFKIGLPVKCSGSMMMICSQGKMGICIYCDDQNKSEKVAFKISSMFNFNIL